MSDQKYVIGVPSTSNESLPSSVTWFPTDAVWFGPAMATGGELIVLTVTLAFALAVPVLTVRPITYAPATSAVNDGSTLAGFDSTAEEPDGLEVNDHEYVSGPPAGLNEPLPFSVTVVPSATV